MAFAFSPREVQRRVLKRWSPISRRSGSPLNSSRISETSFNDCHYLTYSRHRRLGQRSVSMMLPRSAGLPSAGRIVLPIAISMRSTTGTRPFISGSMPIRRLFAS